MISQLHQKSLVFSTSTDINNHNKDTEDSGHVRVRFTCYLMETKLLFFV